MIADGSSLERVALLHVGLDRPFSHVAQSRGRRARQRNPIERCALETVDYVVFVTVHFLGSAKINMRWGGEDEQAYLSQPACIGLESFE